MDAYLFNNDCIRMSFDDVDALISANLINVYGVKLMKTIELLLNVYD